MNLNAMKCVLLSFVILLLYTSNTFAQYYLPKNVISEAPIKYIKDKRMSNLITIHFKNETIKRAQKKTLYTHLDIDKKYNKISSHFRNLENQYGDFYLQPIIPEATWGDTSKVTATGEIATWTDVSQMFYVKFSQFVPIDLIIAEFNSINGIRYAHGPVQIVPLNDPLPNDNLFNETDQWGLFNVRGIEAWEITQGSEDVWVGIIENKHSDQTHPDLSSEFVPGLGEGGGIGANYGDHPTAVAGVIGAATNNTTGIASLGWKTRMGTWNFGIASDCTSVNGLSSTIRNAASSGVDVINMSFIIVNNNIVAWDCSLATGGDCVLFKSYDYLSVKNAMKYAKSNFNVIFVAGSGNTGTEATNQRDDCKLPICFPFIPDYIAYPAAYNDYVIGVSAIDVNDNFGSNSGNEYNKDAGLVGFIDVTAPGINILTTYSTSYAYVYENGTSFSGPVVTALIGLMRSINSNINFSTARNAIVSTAVNLNDPIRFGAGKIDAYEALKEIFPIKISNDITQNTTWGTDDFALFRDPNNPPNIYVDGVNLTVDAGATVVIESGIRVKAINGGSITLNSGAKVICEPGAEIIAGSGCTVTDAGAAVIFKGPGSCMATDGGTLKFNAGVDRVVENGGLIASFNSNGVIELEDDATITIQPSSLLELDPGTTIKLGEDAAIDIYGGIDAVGTSGNPIVFESKYISPPINQYWDGIYVDNPTESSDSSRIHYVTIKNSSWGVFANNGALSIENATIEDCHLYGIRLENSHSTIKNSTIDNTTGIAGMYIRYSDPLLDGNTVTDSNLDGIYLYQADPDLFNNEIKDNGRYGVYTYNYSSPNFGSNTTSTSGYNVISGNQYGIYSYYYSTPFLGDDVIQFPNIVQVGGDNSLYSNTTREIKATTYSDVIAEYNWWGQSPPSISSFESDGTSSINFANELSSDPNLAMSKGVSNSKISNNSPASPLNPDDPRTMLREARSLVRQREVRAGIQKYRQLINEHPTHRTTRWATTELGRTLHDLSPDSSFQYMQRIISNSTNSDFKKMAYDRLTAWYVKDDNYSNAITNAENISQNFPLSESDKHALFDLVNLYLFALKDKANAQLAFLQLKAKFPLDELTNSAELFFDTGRDLKTSPGIQGVLGKNKLLAPVAIPSEFALEQNYPNPFNPSTTIQFSLPVEATAKLSVFNINGQHITTLVDEQLKSGQHEYEWNGTDENGKQVASGIYVYRLKVGNKQLTKQMTLVR